MEKQRAPVLAGYDLVIAKVRDMHEARTGKRHGAIAWLAGKLGITRQTIDNWSDRNGFPPHYVPKVAKITGLSAAVIRPKTVVKEMPQPAWDGICATSPTSFTDQAIDITNQRNRHG